MTAMQLKKNCLVFSKIFNFWISKKIDGLKVWTIYDQHFFFVKNNPIWENWINRQNFHYVEKSDNLFPFWKLEVDPVFRDLYNFAVG